MLKLTSGFRETVVDVFSLLMAALVVLLSRISLFTLATLYLIYYINPLGPLVWFGIGLVTAIITHNTPEIAKPFNRKTIASHYAFVTFIGLYGPIMLGLELIVKHWPESLVIGNSTETQTEYEWDGWQWRKKNKN